jgi:hypothetical protein
MAQENKVTTGGNKPKPPSSSGQSAKDRSRAQSRPVTTKTPAGKAQKASGSGGGKGGNTPRPGSRPPAQPKPSRMSGTLMAWSAVGLVVVVIAVLVIVKTVGGSSTTPTTYTAVTPAPASVVHDVTNIPLSVFNKVGINSPTVPVSPPNIISGQPALTLNGKSPSILYYGAEYCPYCAAERWAITAALSRFGTWSNLKITASSHTDVDAETHTFSFYGASFTSPYISFTGIEQYSNVPTASGYKVLQNPNKAESAILTKYSSSTYTGAGASSSGGISFPFVDINNRAIVSGASYDPAILAGQDWSEIAGNLSDPTNPATQAIVTTANYMTAAICDSTKGAPASVCTSPGVKAAAKALKLS